MFEKSKTLKSAVNRVTTDAGNGEGDPIGVVEIYQELKDRPDLMAEAVKLIKARIKSRNPTTSCLAMDLLNQCMESIGFALQLQVTKKVLPRILKLALSHTQHPDVQRKAAAYIKTWASTYSADARLCAYGNAAKELSRVEEISGRTFPSTFCPVIVSLGDVRSMLRVRAFCASALEACSRPAHAHTSSHPDARARRSTPSASPLPMPAATPRAPSPAARTKAATPRGAATAPLSPPTRRGAASPRPLPWSTRCGPRATTTPPTRCGRWAAERAISRGATTLASPTPCGAGPALTTTTATITIDTRPSKGRRSLRRRGCSDAPAANGARLHPMRRGGYPSPAFAEDGGQ